MPTHSAPRAGDALLVVDVQNDFLPGGSLAVPQGDEVVPVLNAYIALFERAGLPVFASRDWHPPGHCSFDSEGGSWPPHCVQRSRGAEFAAALRLPRQTAVISKGAAADGDAYSAFQGTALASRLRQEGVCRLFVGGLATDYCVLATVTDALAAGFEVMLLRDAVRAVDVVAGDGERALERMQRLGARGVELTGLLA